MSRVLLPFVLIVTLFAGVGYYFLSHQNKLGPILLPLGGVCDKDTMVCSDGSVLKRTGPSCDFPPCPEPVSTGVPVPTIRTSPKASSEGESVKISGIIICLPHRNTNGPQTMECAFGLKADDGNNYGLSDSGFKYLMGVGNGTRVEIKGKLIKKQDEKYNSSGTIEIESLVKS